jgi:hypothetical protein
MIKINQITEDQFNKLKKSKNPVKVFKEIINLQTNKKYGFGDTTIQVENGQFLDVFKNTFKENDIYYIVVKPIDEELSFAYSLYPTF